MKKMFFICCIAVSAFALSTSAGMNNHQNFLNYAALTDTTPTGMHDTMHNNNFNNSMQQNQQNNRLKDTGMSMKRDSASTTPPPHH